MPTLLSAKPTTLIITLMISVSFVISDRSSCFRTCFGLCQYDAKGTAENYSPFRSNDDKSFNTTFIKLKQTFSFAVNKSYN